MPLAALDAIRERIAGPADLVLIEAPAGHGKTFEAVAAAQALAPTLARGEKVLLLSHTNAARDELHGRCAAESVPVHAQTFDSLACDIVQMFTSRLELARPLRPGAVHVGQPSFGEIRHMACAILREAPVVARGLAARYPVILADEYQDSTDDHHEMLWRIRAARPVRVRLFADRLQAIFGFDGDLVDWPALVEAHGAITLRHGHRWDAQPELRDWLAAARAALLTGSPLPIGDRPACVHLTAWRGRAPGPGQRGWCPECVAVLRGLRCPGRVVWLVRNREHAYGLAARLSWRVRLYEAGDVEEPLAWLQRAEAAGGSPAELALVLCDLLRAWGSGITLDLRRQLAEVCGEANIELGRRTRVAGLAGICEHLYADASVAGFLRAVRAALDARTDLGWDVVRRDAAYLLWGVPDVAEDPVLAVQALAQARRARRAGTGTVMTVHKSKGREFDSVVLPYMSATSFGADGEGARLAYVALTRAQRELHLLVPSEGPSPLLAPAG